MKYHGYVIEKTATDLGESDPRLNCVYMVSKNGQFKAEALTLSTAKQYIDNGEDDNYL